MVICITTVSITKDEVNKYLYISIFNVIVMPSLIVLFPIFFYLFPARIPSDIVFTIVAPLLVWFFTILVQGIVSLIFYFANYEIMYGMWKKKKRKEKFENRNFRIGKRIMSLIIIPGVFVHAIFLFFTVYLLSITLS